MVTISRGSVLAFDVYGTLINPHALTGALQDIVGDSAAHVSEAWRQKQLEYSFRRGLMADYVPFATITQQALDYALAACGATATADQKAMLLAKYRVLDAFPDAHPALTALRSHGMTCHAFSNGDPEDIESLLRAQDLWGAMAGAVSVRPAQSFKPDPAVYAHFETATGATADRCWLVSSNPFDVIGAIAAGWQAAWIQRSPAAVFDPWGVTPTVILPSLKALSEMCEN